MASLSRVGVGGDECCAPSDLSAIASISSASFFGATASSSPPCRRRAARSANKRRLLRSSSSSSSVDLARARARSLEKNGSPSSITPTASRWRDGSDDSEPVRECGGDDDEAAPAAASVRPSHVSRDVSRGRSKSVSWRLLRRSAAAVA